MPSFVLSPLDLSILACKEQTLPSFGWSNKPLGWRNKESLTTTNKSRKAHLPYIAIKKSYKVAASAANVDEHSLADGVEKSTVVAGKKASSDGLLPEQMPRHVAIVMDGYQIRSSEERDLSHEAGNTGDVCRTLKDIGRLCCDLGIKVLSIHISSSSKFDRPQEEADFSMNITESAVKSELEELARNDVRISIIGNRSAISKPLQEIIELAEEATKENKTLHIIGALDYTGRSDIIQACITLVEKVKDGLIEPDDISEGLIEQELQTKCSEYPHPDLMIRISDKHRLGNFMLWQLAYSELYFVDKHPYDFKEDDFVQALSSYQKRHRRFGGHKY